MRCADDRSLPYDLLVRLNARLWAAPPSWATRHRAYLV